MLQKMYSVAHWIAVIRMFGYQAIRMDEARAKIKPVADEFGKEPVAQACESLVEIFNEGKEPHARLKAHIRRMAFQILGPESSAVAIALPTVPEGESKSRSKPQRRLAERKSWKAETPASQPAGTENPRSQNDSPIMQQYREAKEKHPGMILLFRIGDFYEVFGDDAETCNKVLGLTLTTLDQSHTMAGFPHHQLETYLHKLLKEGLRVAVCDQVDTTMKSVRREITRVVTPGSVAEKPIKQPRHFVLKKFEEWMKEQGLAFVAIDDVKKTTPAVAPHVASLDFIVLRGEEKLLVTVRPHLQQKHHTAIAELQKLFGSEYRHVRIWPAENADGWKWQEHSVDASQIAPPSSRRKGKA